MQYRVIDMGGIIEVYSYSDLRIEEKRLRTEEQKALDKLADQKWDFLERSAMGFDDLGQLQWSEWNEGKFDSIEGDKKEIQHSWDRSLEYRKTVSHRRREIIRRYANMNFKKDCHFVTLTYAENMKDVTQGNKDFKDFIKRLKRAKYTKKVKGSDGKTRYENVIDLKYLAVAEFQDRGAVHYHVLINLVGFDLSNEDQIRQSERDLAEIWGNGFADIKRIHHVDNVGAYIVKYLQKGFMDPRTQNVVMYLTSRNLIKPKIIKGDHATMIAESLLGCIPNYTNEYSSFYHGDIHYREYNLERLGIERE